VKPTDVLADIGSGKGRGVLLAASRYPFARVIGVEHDERLHRRAKVNLEKWRGPNLSPVELVHADALEWPLPADLSIVLLFNPFVGSTFTSFIESLAAHLREHPRPLRLVYYNARMHEAVVASGFNFVGRFGRVSVYLW
jgi:predicted RNA methylase